MSVTIWSGFDRSHCRDWSGVVADWMRAYLPEPQIDPRCVKDGHRWAKPMVLDWGSSGEINVYGCIRCAKRGLVVLTDSNTDSEPS